MWHYQADPTGEYIRYFVPELGKVRGEGAYCDQDASICLSSAGCVDVHNPSAKIAEKLGYPTPLVKHDEARQRAIRRYKNPGDN